MKLDRRRPHFAAAALVVAAALGTPARAQNTATATGAVSAQPNDVELAKKLAHPVAALISVPLQLNYDKGIGPANDGKRWLLNIQQVVPIDRTDD